MICPNCKGETNVIDSRAVAQSVRRRRECLRCTARFTTFEIISTATQTHVENLIIVDRRDFANSIRGALEVAMNATLLKPTGLAIDSTANKVSECRS